MSESRCIVVGASHAGVQLALSLRVQGWTGAITLLDEGNDNPYHRPPLSKDFLTAEKSEDALALRPAAQYEKQAIDFRAGARVTAIDRVAQTVELATGETLAYDALALTTGTRPRLLSIPGADLPGVFYLRSLADARAIRGALPQARHAVIVGGGYIGLEAAASLRKLGLAVTVLEAMPRVLARVTTEALSAFYQNLHAAEGVEIITDIVVQRFSGDDRVSAVHSACGRSFPADLVIVGIGVLPNTALAEAAGLDVGNGIRVDGQARTSDPRIVAAGDCTWHYNPIYQREMRLESVQNASDQAKVAAATVCGKEETYAALPWFWSDQYDVKLQIAGLTEGYEQAVVRGDLASRSFAVFYLREQRILAVDAVNRPQEFMVGKRLIVEGSVVAPETLADEAVAPKSWLS